MKAKLMLGGMKSYIPALCDFRGTGGTVSTSYCYSVWLRHLSLIDRHGLNSSPETLVELGPGDSIGVGLAAMLSGVERYLALDVVQHAENDLNLAIFDELVPLMRARTPIPDETDLPLLRPALPAYGFPHEILSESRLERSLHPARVRSIREQLAGTAVARERGPAIRYICPWTDPTVVEPGSADLVLSQGALQDVQDLGDLCRSMYGWLRPGGVMSHHIDFRGGDSPNMWNAHWTYSDLQWRIVRGNRPYYVNRVPLSGYLSILSEAGFEVVAVTGVEDSRTAPRRKLAPRFREVPDDDLTTSAAHLLAIKR